MGCCSWPLSLVAWCLGEYSPKKYDMESYSSEEIPVPRFRDLGELKNRVTRKYDLRPTKAVCYTESDDDASADVGFD